MSEVSQQSQSVVLPSAQQASNIILSPAQQKIEFVFFIKGLYIKVTEISRDEVCFETVRTRKLLFFLLNLVRDVISTADRINHPEIQSSSYSDDIRTCAVDVANDEVMFSTIQTKKLSFSLQSIIEEIFKSNNINAIITIEDNRLCFAKQPHDALMSLIDITKDSFKKWIEIDDFIDMRMFEKFREIKGYEKIAY
jgi:hypothetical protein